MLAKNNKFYRQNLLSTDWGFKSYNFRLKNAQFIICRYV